MSMDALKDFFRWNDCTVGGTKDELIARVLDLEKNGRPVRCGECTGQMKYEPDNNRFQCNGGWSDELNARISCSLRVAVDKVARLPFVTEKPSEEEFEAIKEANKAVDESKVADTESKIAATAEGLAEVDFTSREGMKEGAQRLLDACRELNVKDLGEDDMAARIKIGSFISQCMSTGDNSINSILTAIVSKLGVEKTEEEQQAAADRAAGSCTNAANGGMYAMLIELSGFYFKEGNANAGNTYKKAAAAISEVGWVLNAETIKGSQKKGGPYDINGVGKGTADKLAEFFKTGTCEKLEEKRANAAS